MNLALDIGNTRIKAGLFQGRELLDVAQWDASQWPEVVAYARQVNVKWLMMASVAPLSTEFRDRLWLSVNVPLELTHDTPLPFLNTYRTPHTLGRDRLAAVAGAQALWPQKDCLVVDCGTCIKYDAITHDGTYLGGNISPGAHMRLKALNAFTAQLPLVAMQVPEYPIGHDTTTALQNGALLGAALEIAGFVQVFERRLPNLTTVLTGGDATFFQALLPFEPIVEPHLTLHGLNHILLFNTSFT